MPSFTPIDYVQTKCPLFRLPAEIRNIIYTFALTVETGHRAGQPRTQDAVPLTNLPKHSRLPTVLSLLQTCRLIHNEAYGIFYSTQALHLGIWDSDWRSLWTVNRSLPRLVRALSKPRLSAIRKLNITVDRIEYLTPIFKAFRHLPTLERVRLCLNRHKYGGSPHCRLLELRRETDFIHAAIAKFPVSLEHLYFSVEESIDSREFMESYEISEFKEQLVKTLAKPGRGLAEGAGSAKRGGCTCMWCCALLRIRRTAKHAQ